MKKTGIEPTHVKARHILVLIKPARSPEHVVQFRALLLEYANSIGFDLSFQNFQKELDGLPGDYVPPGGELFLAWDDSQVIGCVALRSISEEVCEMKRLFVRPRFRGEGIGRMLAIAIIEEARRLKYKRMRLDTVPSMVSALSLYYSLGFKEIQPYRHNPIPGAKFLEVDLDKKT